MKKAQTPIDEARPLTPGEIAISRQLFGDSIDYGKVKVHRGEYLWFGLQPDDTAMTPNGEIYFNPKHFKEDFSTASEFRDALWFMHEMVHVWQYQLGYPVKTRGAVRLGLSYEYSLDETKTLGDFNMEAQGNLLADYWALSTRIRPPVLNNWAYATNLALYKTVLRKFIANPADKANLP